MDYEKKYKEALERAKQFSEKPYLEDSKDIVEYIFPELKESENERIRKEMVDFMSSQLKSLMPPCPSNEKLKKWIAWLEKQGKQKPVECCADKLWTEFKKQVAYLMASSYNREHEYTKGYVEWVAQSLLGYAKNEIEQKPAEWSEEDKTMLCYMEGHLEYLKNDKGYSSSEDQIMLKRQLEWLKSLKDRCLPQPKQEWSGEDEKHYQGCLNLMKLSLDTKPYPYYNDYLWLKSLRPQNRWKPTDEQIEAVEKALSLAKNCGEEYSFDLRTLLEQLKAL